MPLPDSALLSLQVNSNALQSKPKRAMIVRMTAETLDALADALPAHPSMSFDFGDAPGIYIGDTFFSMRPQRESSPHELYLRATSAAKPMAPLKFYANVIGKFMLEPQLGDKVSRKVREHTIAAEQQHKKRQAIVLAQPPLPVSSKNGKRKTPGSHKQSQSEHLRLPSSSARKVSPIPQSTPSTKVNSDVRRRLVQFLAVSPRLTEDAVKMVGGANIVGSARGNLLALLEEVAEQMPAKKGDKSPRPWQLKPQTWIEVRPYEWPKLSEAERIDMARRARVMFGALKIPETDPVWEYVRHRPSVPTGPTTVPAAPPMTASNSARSSTGGQSETKRSGHETKSKSKQDPGRAKGEIQMKDESAKAPASRVSAVKRAEVDRAPSPSEGSANAKAVASRRLPGSGYQKKSTQSSPEAADRSVTARSSHSASLPPKPSPATSPASTNHTRKTIPPKPTKKEDESDRERDREYERQKEREREKREKEKEKLREERERERERLDVEKREKAKQKEREVMEREKRLREKEMEREEMELLEKRQREKERMAKERAAVASFQRKTQLADDTPDDTSKVSPVLKRRKLADGTSVASSSTARDTALAGSKMTHEPSPVPRLKMKKDRASPQPSTGRVTSSASGSTHKSERPSKTSGSTKSRRRSPIYTSSEDEGEIPQPRKRNPSPPPVSDRSNSSDQLPVTTAEKERASRHHRTPRAAYPPASDHAALRALYQSQYADYLGTFSKIVAQKCKLEAMLNGDSDAEVDVMDPDDLLKLTAEHRSLKTELEHIQDIYTKGAVASTA